MYKTNLNYDLNEIVSLLFIDVIYQLSSFKNYLRIFGNSQLCTVELKMSIAVILFCQAIFMLTGTKYFCRGHDQFYCRIIYFIFLCRDRHISTFIYMYNVLCIYIFSQNHRYQMYISNEERIQDIYYTDQSLSFHFVTFDWLIFRLIF